DPNFVDLTEQLSSDRNDDQLRAIVKKMYFFSVANPNPVNWLQNLSVPYENEQQQEALLQLLNELAMIFMTSALESLNKSYDVFMMLEEVDKQVAGIVRETQFSKQGMEDGYLTSEIVTQHEFDKTFARKDNKIKEGNEIMIDAYDDGKAYYED